MTAFVGLAEAREATDKVYEGPGALPTGWILDTTFGLNGNGQASGSAGGYVYAIKPSGLDDGRRMLVFRGTEVTFANLKDVYADVSDIGREQFNQLDEFVNPWLAQQLVNENRVEIVGHSLGGALVQWAINDTNMREENQDNNATVFSVLERARTISGDDNFPIDPSKLHFTTFNAPGISRVLGGAPTDRTSVIVGEHHVEWSLAMTAD